MIYFQQRIEAVKNGKKDIGPSLGTKYNQYMSISRKKIDGTVKMSKWSYNTLNEVYDIVLITQ